LRLICSYAFPAVVEMLQCISPGMLGAVTNASRGNHGHDHGQDLITATINRANMITIMSTATIMITVRGFSRESLISSAAFE
jgi:hypothetical protein